LGTAAMRLPSCKDTGRLHTVGIPLLTSSSKFL
jgi:hypothetical protein